MKDTLRQDTLREAFAAMLPALDPARAVRARLQVRDGALLIDERKLVPREFTRVRLIAIGKAALPMARATVEVLASAGFDLALSGVAVAPHGNDGDAPQPLRTLRAGHPIPDAGSLRAADAVRDELAGCTARDLVLFLLSGGGSALCEAPLHEALLRADTALADVQAFHRALVGSGLDIVAMNTLRKHASATKGGRLAQWAAPAAQATLFVSDVPAAHADAVASGPSMPDPTTRATCRALLVRGDLASRLPDSYRDLLASPRLPETPKAGDPAFARSSWHCLLDTGVALDALRQRLAQRGWQVEIDTSIDDAPVADAATYLLRRLRALKATHPARTVALLTGGELSCPLTGDGVGGRNQHFALLCAMQIEGEAITVLSAGTDGIDGNSPAAGAVADGSTCARAWARGLDPRRVLARCDSFTLFAALGDAVITQPTGTNVRDVRVLVM